MEKKQNKTLLSSKDLAGEALLGAFKIKNSSSDTKRRIIEDCLAKGADINYKDKQGKTALMKAVENEDKELVDFLLTCKGIDVNLQNKELGKSALMIAAENGNAEIVQLLLNKGANLSLEATDGKNAMGYACHKLNIEVMEKLINSEGFNINAPICGKADNYETPLINAVRREKTEIVEFLLRKGADVNARDGSGNTPLITAINRMRYLKEDSKDQNKIMEQNNIIDTLLAQKNIDVNLQNSQQKTALDRCYKVKKIISRNSDGTIKETKISSITCAAGKEIVDKLKRHNANFFTISESDIKTKSPKKRNESAKTNEMNNKEQTKAENINKNNQIRNDSENGSKGEKPNKAPETNNEKQLENANVKNDNQAITRRNSNQSFSKDLGGAIDTFEQQLAKQTGQTLGY